LPTKRRPSLRLGVAFERPAPITLIEPVLICLLVTFAIFCIREASPVGAVFVKMPAVVLTYSSVPSGHAGVSVSKPSRLPKVTISQEEFKDAAGKIQKVTVKLFPWEELNYAEKVKTAFSL